MKLSSENIICRVFKEVINIRRIFLSQSCNSFRLSKIDFQLFNVEFDEFIYAFINFVLICHCTFFFVKNWISYRWNICVLISLWFFSLMSAMIFSFWFVSVTSSRWWMFSSIKSTVIDDNFSFYIRSFSFNNLTML